MTLTAKTTILFRADGNSQIGLGHVMRCLGLAELLQQDFECAFAIRQPNVNLFDQLRKICPQVIDLPETDLIEEAEAIAGQLTGHEIIVLDGYNFTTQYQQILKKKCNILVFIDDLHDRKIVADVVLNSAGGLDPKVYTTAAYTKLFLGPEYVLLRKPFREVQKTLPLKPEKVRQILICFGGADPENHTLHYVKDLVKKQPAWQLEIITGSAYRHHQEMATFLVGKPQLNWHRNLGAAELATLMAQCQAALCSSSVIAYEYCAVTGLLFVKQTAGNQQDLFNYLTSFGLAFPADKIYEAPEMPAVVREEMKDRQRSIFNGSAETNLKRMFNQLGLQAQLTFRKFTLEDADLLFEWVNDPVVRQFSFSSDPIPYENHFSWVKNKLGNPNSLLLFAEIQGQPVAHLRFDRNGSKALISYQIGKNFRGKGLGHRVLQVGLLELKKYFPEVTEAVGYVQPKNIASVRAFEKAEFENRGNNHPEQPGAFKFTKDL